MGGFTPGKTLNSRVVLIKNRAGPANEPDFQDCMAAGALEYNFGDSEPIKAPDPERFGETVDVGEIQAVAERPTTSLVGRYASDLRSLMLDLARKKCPFDVHINFGECSDPRDNNTFSKKVAFMAARGGSYSTDDLGSLEENSAVNETLEVSGIDFVEVMPLSFSSKGGDAVTNPLNDVIICSIVSCGDCEEEDDGCDNIYAVGESTPGSPGTSPDIVYSVDNGVTWFGTDINTIAVGNGADGVACLETYIVAVSADEASLHYITKSDLDTTPPAAGFTEITTGFVGSNFPVDIWSVGNYAFIAGLNGYIYGSSDPTVGVTVLDAAIATTDNLNAVHALNDKFAVMVGASGRIVKTENQVSWSTVTGPTGVSDGFDAVWLLSEDDWWIGTDAGELYYTRNGGTTWTQKVLPNQSTVSTVNDIAFSNDTLMYVATTTTTTAGRLYRSYDGGYSFVIMPEGTAVMPANDSIKAVAACGNDVNFVVGVGTADDALDGFLTVGQD